MAWINQEKKATIATALKAVMPKGWKYSLAVEHHTTLILTISAAPVDLIAKVNEARTEYKAERGYADINNRWIDRAFKDQAMVEIFEKINAALNDGNHDRSDIQSDYFDVGWYVDIKIGRWNKPFTYLQPVAEAA